MSMLRYEIYTNQTIDVGRDYVPSCEGYRPGAHMRLAYKGELHEDFDVVEAALEQLFYIFNMQHPADYQDHSLSIGDVVVLIDANDKRTAWSCAMFGFEQVGDFDPTYKNPAWIDFATYSADRAKYQRPGVRIFGTPPPKEEYKEAKP